MSSPKLKLCSRWCSVLLAGLLALSAAGCGGSGEEGSSEDFFYVYVVHGYAGGGELSVYGSAGPLATGLTFGDIGGDPEVAGAPLKVDRTRFDGQVQILLSGATEVATIALDSFAFYPGETVTLFLTRRSGPNTYDLRVMRHHKLAQIPPANRIDEDPAYECVISVNNGFSLSNVYTPNAFDIQLQWQPSAPPTDPASGRLIYDSPRDNSVESVCGVLTPADFNMAPAGAQASVMNAISTRQMLLASIAQNPWYYFIRGETGYLEFRAATWESPEGGGATLNGIRSSREYQQCIASAIQVPVTMNSDGAPSCDRTKFNEIQVDDVRLRDCNRLITYPGIPISPDNQTGQVFYLQSNGTECNFTFRPRTRNVDLVFDELGEVDALPVFRANYPRDSWTYYTFFGDPITPYAYRLRASDDPAGLVSALATIKPAEANNGRDMAAPAQ